MLASKFGYLGSRLLILHSNFNVFTLSIQPPLCNSFFCLLIFLALEDVDYEFTIPVLGQFILNIKTYLLLDTLTWLNIVTNYRIFKVAVFACDHENNKRKTKTTFVECLKVPAPCNVHGLTKSLTK